MDHEAKLTTFDLLVEWIKDGDQQVDEHGKVERNVAPKTHVRAEPVEPGLLPQLALPLHFVPHAVDLLEEARYLAVLLVLLCGQKDALLGLVSQVLANSWHRKNYLLHGSVFSNDLERSRRQIQSRGQMAWSLENAQ